MEESIIELVSIFFLFLVVTLTMGIIFFSLRNVGLVGNEPDENDEKLQGTTSVSVYEEESDDEESSEDDKESPKDKEVKSEVVCKLTEDDFTKA